MANPFDPNLHPYDYYQYIQTNSTQPLGTMINTTDNQLTNYQQAYGGQLAALPQWAPEQQKVYEKAVQAQARQRLIADYEQALTERTFTLLGMMLKDGEVSPEGTEALVTRAKEIAECALALLGKGRPE